MKHLLSFLLVAALMRVHAQSITACRWWINDDVSTLATTVVAPAAELDLTTDLDLPPLTKDFNTVTVQFMDSAERYSVPYTMLFSRGTGAVNAYEWWIDDDVAGREEATIGPDAVVDLIADIPTGVAAGTHTFTIRFKGTNGTWSVPLITEFSSTVSIEELPQVSGIVLFPNPVSDDLSVRLNVLTTQQLRLRLLDVQGRTLRELPTWTVTGTGVRTWDISDLASGGYLLRVTDGSGSVDLPFLKP